MRNREYLHKKFNQEPNNQLFAITYNRYRNFRKASLKKMKRTYGMEILTKAANKQKNMSAYKDITNMTGVRNIATELIFQVSPQKVNSINQSIM